jgi:hypothetical protein
MLTRVTFNLIFLDLYFCIDHGLTMALCALKASIILWLLLGNCFSSFSLTEISDRGDVHCVGSLQFGAPDSLVHASCDGDIVMTGRYFEVGMHRAGSLGTSSSIVSPIATAMPGAPLGMNADYDRNGFDAYSACNIVDPWYYYGGTPQEVCPTYAGDFVTPGAPVEGSFHLFHDQLSLSLTRTHIFLSY